VRPLVICCLLFLAGLPGPAATNFPSARSLLLNEKTVVDLTAGLSQYENLPKLTGKLVSGGSGLVTLLVNRWASEFATLYSDVVLDIQGGGSVASLPAFLAGKVDLMPMARPLLPDELKQCKDKFGYEPAQIIVAQDAVGIYVNKNNPLAGLTLIQLDGIYSRDHKRGGKRAEFWADLGVTGPLAQARITRLALSSVHGSHEFFRDTVMLGSDYRFGGHFESLLSSLVQAVGADEAGVGFGSVMFGSVDPDTGESSRPPMELVRLAIPRRVYTQSHIDYVVEAACEVFNYREQLRGLRIIEAPPVLRHFTAKFEPIGNS